MVGASKISFKRFPLRWRLVGGALFAAGGSVMFSFVRRDDQYFPLVFPGLIVGSSGECERQEAKRRRDAFAWAQFDFVFWSNKADMFLRSCRQFDIIRIDVRGPSAERSGKA